jgi:hypothetical protein
VVAYVGVNHTFGNCNDSVHINEPDFPDTNKAGIIKGRQNL